MNDSQSILVVDDESESLSLLTGILAAEGYHVRSANSGQLALASIATWLPELIAVGNVSITVSMSRTVVSISLLKGVFAVFPQTPMPATFELAYAMGQSLQKDLDH